MKYSIDPRILEINEQLRVSILIAKGLKNRTSSEAEIEQLRRQEQLLRRDYEGQNVREIPSIVAYREFLSACGINPNRFPASIEAMVKRIVKGSELPALNHVVDEVNRLSLQYLLSMGAHDLEGIEDDLCIAFSDGSERFLPLGETQWEELGEGELVFKSGSVVQTRRWIWRQSEIGKTTADSENIFFHLVGFHENVYKAADAIEILIEKLGGSFQRFDLSKDCREVEWSFPK